MGILNQILYVGHSNARAMKFIEEISGEGFSCVLLEPEQKPQGEGQSRPAAVLLSAELPAASQSLIAQQIKERFSYVPLLLITPDPSFEIPKGNIFFPYDGLLCATMPPSNAAILLRGAIRLSFTIQELVQSNRRLNEISITDALTGLYNRGYMIDRLNLEFKRAARNREILSCLMIDLDHFKRINDTYGHKFGDFILEAFSSRLKGLIRETDIFGRYGGEEFLIILPNTNLEGGRHLAEKLRAGLEAEKIQHDCFSLLVTASFGVASIENNEVVTADHLLQLSDRALYKAKETGRNRVCVTGVSEPVEEFRPVRPAGTVDRLPHHPSLDVVSADPSENPHIQALLESADFELTLHSTEEEFLDVFRERSPHLVILDQKGSVINVLGLCRRIKTQIQDLFIPLLVLLERTDDQSHEEALQAGADDVVTPDLPPREFMARLQTLSHLKNLHDRWRGTYQDLNMTRTRLVKAERLNALGEMASGVAHDFNNILSAILGRTQLLRQRISDPPLLQDLLIIEQAANDGAATIRRIQEFARATTDRIYHVVDMAQIVHDCIQMTRTPLEGTRRSCAA